MKICPILYVSYMHEIHINFLSGDDLSMIVYHDSCILLMDKLTLDNNS